jgi:hypothetical protein
MEDSLKVVQNEDGSFCIEWNKEDPNWSFLNHLTSNEIESMIKEAIEQDSKN